MIREDEVGVMREDGLLLSDGEVGGDEIDEI